MEKLNRDIVIIGGGAGGLCVASVAAQLNLNVTLIEKENHLGGDCLHYGCVPSKTLINTAKIAHYINSAEKYGLENIDKKFDWLKVKKHIANVIEKIQVHDSIERFEKLGCQVILGNAKFISPYEIEINGKIIKSKKFVLAMGSRPKVGKITGLSEIDFLTNENIFSMENFPERLFTLGAGPVGLELSQALRRLGSNVTILEKRNKLLSFLPVEISLELENILKEEGINFVFNSNVLEVKKNSSNLNIFFDDRHLEVDNILIATGRRPNVEEIDLEKAFVEYDNSGINVNDKLQTSQKHIYALGDVIKSRYKFTHISEYQSGIIISNAIFKFPKKVNYSTVPSVIYTDPELAQVGMLEKEAHEKKINFTIEEFHFKQVDRAITDIAEKGRARFIISKNKIIGATILGAHAGEIIHEIALAINTKTDIKKIADTIHAYPTLSQINRRVINKHYSKLLYNDKVKKIVYWLNRIFG